MVAVVPTSADLDNLSIGRPVTVCASWLTRDSYEPTCALCRIGCCVQRVSMDMDTQRAVAVHGVLGEG